MNSVSEEVFTRFLFLTEEKRLVMPPGSKLVLTPTLALPFLRFFILNINHDKRVITR